MTELNKPTGKELEILQVLWSKGPSTVRTVNDYLSTGKEIGYTTTLKLLQIMFNKGLVSRTKEGKTHIYHPEVSEKSTQKRLVDQMMKNVFKGSAMGLVMQALGSGKSSKKELDEIRAYLDELEGGKK